MPSIPDKLSTLSSAQAITASAASTNAIKLDETVTTNGQALGRTLWLRVNVDTDFATLTSLVVTLQTSDDNSTYVDLVSTAAIAAASLVAGYVFIPIAAGLGFKKWVRAYYTVAGSNATAGAVTAELTNCITGKNTFTYVP